MKIEDYLIEFNIKGANLVVLKEALKQEVLEAVGENDSMYTDKYKGTDLANSKNYQSLYARVRNDLRAEIRQRIAKLFDE